MSAHLLFIGGEDHDLRMPFLTMFRDRGFRVTAAGSGPAEPFAAAGIDYKRFHFERFINPIADWRALKTIRELVAGVQPDLVQTFDTKLNFMVPIALQDAGPPVVRTINGRGWLYSSGSPKALLLRPVYRALHRRAARSTQATTFEHPEDQSFFARYAMTGVGRDVIIPGAGLDVEGFERAKAEGPAPAAMRQALGVGDSEVVVTVTRMTRQKGIGTLLEAAALVHAQRPNVRFLLVGPRESEGPLAISQDEIDRHKPYVIATGPRKDVPSILGMADVFAFPTEYREGIPRVLMEAAIANVPIVTTNMPGCREVVQDDVSGYVVPPFSPEIFAAKIVALLADRQKATAMGRQAALPVREKFSLTAIVDGYVKLYGSLLEETSQHTSGQH